MARPKKIFEIQYCCGGMGWYDERVPPRVGDLVTLDGVEYVRRRGKGLVRQEHVDTFRVAAIGRVGDRYVADVDYLYRSLPVQTENRSTT